MHEWAQGTHDQHLVLEYVSTHIHTCTQIPMNMNSHVSALMLMHTLCGYKQTGTCMYK